VEAVDVDVPARFSLISPQASTLRADVVCMAVNALLRIVAPGKPLVEPNHRRFKPNKAPCVPPQN
jgi:hypothetical protein